MKAATSGLLRLAAGDVCWPEEDAVGGFMPLSVRLVSIHRFIAQFSIVPSGACRTKQIFCARFPDSTTGDPGSEHLIPAVVGELLLNRSNPTARSRARHA
jgi:hypothetical protein